VEVDPSILAVEDLGHKVHVTDDGRRAHVLEVLNVHVLMAKLRLRLLHGQELPGLLRERELVERVRQVREVRDVVRVLEDRVGVEELVGECVGEALRKWPFWVWSATRKKSERSPYLVRPIPRGSNPMRSHSSPIRRRSESPLEVTMLTPDPPGPPADGRQLLNTQGREPVTLIGVDHHTSLRGLLASIQTRKGDVGNPRRRIEVVLGHTMDGGQLSARDDLSRNLMYLM
jgi:hypothetical protein